MNFLTILSAIIFKIIGIVGIGFLIGFHELGHFLFCKLFKIKTPSFSIGFGPQLLSKKIGDTVFSISAIPLGGYVEIAGAAEVGQGEQKDAHCTDEYSFASKPYLQKLAVMIGGILFNLFFAYVAFILLFATGIPKTRLIYPKNATPVISHIQQHATEKPSGLKADDTIIAFTYHETGAPASNTVTINDNIHTFLDFVKSHPDQAITLTIKRKAALLETISSTPETMNAEHEKNIEQAQQHEQSAAQSEQKDTIQEITVTPYKKNAGWPIGTIGELDAYFAVTDTPSHTAYQAIKMGIQETNQWIIKTIADLMSLFSERRFGEMAGPLMIISMTSTSAAASMKIFFALLAIISINLAILNLIPLPVFDGGQILFYSIEALIGRPLPNRIREYIHIASWCMLLALILYISFNDIVRIAEPYMKTIWSLFGFSK